MKRSLLLVLGLAMVACSPTPSSIPGASAQSAIEAANARFLDAFKRGDKAAMMANYADDAIVMMPNAPAWRGKDGMDKGYSDFLAKMTYKDGTVKTDSVVLSGDLAVETGTYAWTLLQKSGSEVKDQGKYLTVWKHLPDGSWKILRDINNTDLPAK